MTSSTLYWVFKANFGVESSKQVTSGLHTISRLLCRMKERYARTRKFPLSLTQGHWAQVIQQLPLSQYLGFIVLSTPSYLRLQTSVRVDFGHNRYSISKRFQLQPVIYMLISCRIPSSMNTRVYSTDYSKPVTKVPRVVTYDLFSNSTSLAHLY